MTKSIHQEVTIKASAKKVFDALTDAKQFSAFSGGAPAEIDATAGGSFSCFGGHIIGRNIELVPGKRVVQAWRPVKWVEGVYSIVFKTRDLAKAKDFLKSKQLLPEPDGTDSVVLGKDQAFGMVVGFTQRALSNDPR